MRAVGRWALADLRTHRGQATFIALAAAGITAALLLSVSMLAFAADPWQRLFAATRGAQVWLRVDGGTDTAALSRLAGVTGVSGPFPTASVTIGHGADRAALSLRGAGTQPPAVGRPEVVGGHWLDGDPNAVVLEKSVAAALGAQPGEQLTVAGTGTSFRVRVAGVAATAEVGYSPAREPGVGWAPPSLVAALAAPDALPSRTVGLRLSDPGQTSYMVQRAVTLVGPDHVLDVSTWYDARSQAAGDNHLLGLLIGLFGLGALLAAAVAVTGGIVTRVLAHVRDIAILRVVGFTPAQVVGMFLIQHLFLSVVGVGAGALLTELLGARVPGSLSQATQVWQALPGHAVDVTGICAATVLVMALATVLAAVRAVRVRGIPAPRTTPPVRRRMSGVARRALDAGVPVALVLAGRATVNRPGRSVTAVLRLALPVLMITLALGSLTTLDRIDRHPAQVGLADRLTARPYTLPDATARRELAAVPGVAAVHPEAELAALEPGQTGSVTLRGIGTAARPYPFAVVEGRRPLRSDEAVAGQGLLDSLNASVGDWVRLTVGSTPCILHIVGRAIETDDDGRVVSTTFDTLKAQGLAGQPQLYGVTTRPGAPVAAVRAALARAGHDGFDVHTVADPVALQLSPVRGVVLGLVTVLGFVALIELLTTIATAVRDHSVDLRAYRSIGLTPSQIVATMVATTSFLALPAVVLGAGLGAPLAYGLINEVGRSTGIGAGIAQPLSPLVLVLLAFLCLAVTLAASLFPALHAEQRRERPHLTVAA